MQWDLSHMHSANRVFSVNKYNPHYTYLTHSARVVWELWVLGLHTKSPARSPGRAVRPPTFWSNSQRSFIRQGEDHARRFFFEGVSFVVVWVTGCQGIVGVWKTSKITAMVVGRIGELEKMEVSHFCQNSAPALCSNYSHIISLMSVRWDAL